MRRATRFLLGGVAYLGTVGLLNLADNPSHRERTIVSAEGEAPVFNISPKDCSRYVRLVGNLIGENYSPNCDAWNRRYKDVLVHIIAEGETLQGLHKEGVLEKGMVVGVYNPESSFNNRKDQFGEPVRYTHNIILWGEENGVLVFAHQFGSKQETITEEDLKERGLIPVEIIDSKSN